MPAVQAKPLWQGGEVWHTQWVHTQGAAAEGWDTQVSDRSSRDGWERAAMGRTRNGVQQHSCTGFAAGRKAEQIEGYRAAQHGKQQLVVGQAGDATRLGRGFKSHGFSLITAHAWDSIKLPRGSGRGKLVERWKEAVITQPLH